jgi:hypothetical protein
LIFTGVDLHNRKSLEMTEVHLQWKSDLIPTVRPHAIEQFLIQNTPTCKDACLKAVARSHTLLYGITDPVAARFPP